MNPEIDKYLSKTVRWQQEMKQLRSIALDCGLYEELKWGKPCYSFRGKNIVIIQGFKDYCALLFFNGFLLNDADGILVKTGTNTRVGRQARFTSVQDIVKVATSLKAYIYEAIEVATSGLKTGVKGKSELIIPQEFQKILNDKPALKKAFSALTPGRQRAYVYYFSQPKQSKTRESRIEKYTQQILNGKGLND